MLPQKRHRKIFFLKKYYIYKRHSAYWIALIKSLNEASKRNLKNTLIQWNIYNVQNSRPQLRLHQWHDVVPEMRNRKCRQGHKATKRNRGRRRRREMCWWSTGWRGITPNRVATVMRMANELQLVAQELEPLVFPNLHFSNIIERGMSVYKESSRPEEKQHRQLPVSMFFKCRQTPAQRPWLEE